VKAQVDSFAVLVVATSVTGAQARDAAREDVAADAIALAVQPAERRIVGTCVDHLLGRPRRRRMIGHVQDAPAAVTSNHIGASFVNGNGALSALAKACPAGASSRCACTTSSWLRFAKAQGRGFVASDPLAGPS
jgi:hypothetical protein